MKQVEAALIDMCQKEKKTSKTKTYEDMNVTTFKQNQLGLICVSNTGRDARKLKLDLSKSSNVDLTSDVKNVSVSGQSRKIVQLCLPLDPSKEIVIKMAVKI